MEQKGARLLAFLIGIIFFIFYSVIINAIVGDHILNFPYIVLTIYLFISIFTLPLVSVEAGEKTVDKNPLIGSYSLIFAYLVSPIWVTINLFKN